MSKFIVIDCGVENDMSRVRQRSSSPGDVLKNNLGVGAAIGAGAFVVNYVLMYLFVTIDGLESSEDSWKLVGQILYNAQFVPSELSSGGQSITMNFVTKSSSNAFMEAAVKQSELGSTIPSVVYHIVPILVLLAAGIVAARSAAGQLDTASGAAAGASIAVGTVVLAIVGTFVFEVSGTSAASGSMAPQLVMGVLLVGIVIPAVAGAIGGAVSAEM